MAATYLEFHRGYYNYLDYCTFALEAANDAQNVWINTACRKDHSQKNLSKLTLSYCNISLQSSEETNNDGKAAIVELITLIRSILNTKVSQGSVAMCFKMR